MSVDRVERAQKNAHAIVPNMIRILIRMMTDSDAGGEGAQTKQAEERMISMISTDVYHCYQVRWVVTVL